MSQSTLRARSEQPVPARRRRFAAALALIAVALGSVSCGCPSFLNGNCAMDVDLSLRGADESINDGRAFQVSVALLRQEDPAASITNEEWIRGGERVASTNRSLDFTVQSGEIRVAQVEDPRTTSYTVAEDGRSISIDFNGLGHPEKGGYSRLAIFTDMSARLSERPLVIPYGAIEAGGWDVVLSIGALGVQVVQDDLQ